MNKPIVRNINLSRIIAEAIGLEMERDDKIIMLGEDVGQIGGVFGTSRGLQQRFGEKRVRDTPISEMAFTGMGVGLAMAGYRPLVEIMFADFIGACFEQIINAMSKIPYMSGGNTKIPMVLKTAAGCIGSAAQHSQCLWGTFAHLPGMHVVVPSNPYDYKGLMAAALESDNPVIYIEHKSQMHKRSATFLNNQPVPEERYTVPIGKAAVTRVGSDVTIVAISAHAEHSLVAAETVAAEGIDVEVVDLRSIVPLDIDTVSESAAKTGRLLVVDEDYQSFGLSAEVITRVFESLGPTALKQFSRHTTLDLPIPAAKPLEQVVIPSADSIAAAVRKLAAAS
ncbi:MAG: alpha-ketoacid dehydrogenase subunit beta [Gammaproteobacteria bacterium]|nr:alpha-ketoacid dehydrogenase subunit beta [Gammaproteobacteria bacterium]